MPEEFLDRVDIIAAFYKMCSERMPEGMASGPFVKSGLFRRLGDRLLDDRFVDMVPSFLAGLVVPPPILLRKDPLPAPVDRGVGVFAVDSRRSCLVVNKCQ